MNRNVATPLLLGGHNPTGPESCEGLTQVMFLSFSVSETKSQAAKGERTWARELEVATITYLRVSGLEGLGSPIISGVGSG